MTKPITTEVVVAYSQCPRKAFLIFCTESQALPHEYIRLIDEKACETRHKYLQRIEHKRLDATANNVAEFLSGSQTLLSIQLKANDLVANCDVLTKVHTGASLGTHRYEPTIIIGTHQISKEQRLSILFVGYVLGQLQGQLPRNGIIVGADCKAHKIDMESAGKTIPSAIKALRRWGSNTIDINDSCPPVILNANCSTCQFQQICIEQAEKNDDLSLLDRMTPKIIQHYHKKGIFTIKQLSFIYKPRRRRKRRAKGPVSFKVELQALAIRTGKIYVQELPALARNDVEIFLDFEGIPDQHFQYLIGILVNDSGNRFYYSFWANSQVDEQQIWLNAIEKLAAYPKAPIYHYGSYESRAIESLTKKYSINCDEVKSRLVNLNSTIYGKLYFPTRSNRLKDLGKFVGASWTSHEASGLQSLVWRHRWEETGDCQYKEALLTYNREDCEALWLLTEEVSKIIDGADSCGNIDFTDRPKKHATEQGEIIHEEFQKIIRSAHADYDKKRVTIRSAKSCTENEKKKKGAPKGHPGYLRNPPSKANITICVEPQAFCPKHQTDALKLSDEVIEKFIIDLRFTKNGCKKIVTKYVGQKAYCSKCRKYYIPPKIEEIGTRLFGHAFQAWVIYERIALRLPYRIITQEIQDLFNENASEATLVNFLKYFTEYYTETEKLSIQRILESPFIHADETIINIEGSNYYAWVFTDGKYVVFRMTETREATIAHEFLSEYHGVLISDFYGGYDSIACKQQKCLVHLIRDLNDDLWDNPYNQSYEEFVSQVKNLLASIFEEEKKYGLKKRHLRKLKPSVERFYRDCIDKEPSNCEVVAKYQKRFDRYRESLFTFLEMDDIPWHNNTAESAIRHLAVQRKISGTFFKNVAPQYLLLLGIMQTCRFQDKSVLKFFLSKEIDIEKFKSAKHVKTSSIAQISNQEEKNAILIQNLPENR